MPVNTSTLKFSTCGNIDILDITPSVGQAVAQSGLKSGVACLFCPSSTSVAALRAGDTAGFERSLSATPAATSRQGDAGITPLMFAALYAAALALLAVAALANLVPAVTASRIDPMRALRHD